MHIEEIELYRIRMPMKAPWRTAFGEEHAVDGVLVRLRADGVDGWGESAPYRLPQFSPEWAPGAFALLRDAFGPRLLGREIASGTALQTALGDFKGNHFAKAALDNAWWDAAARARAEPLWQALGGRGPAVRVGADIAVMDSLDALVTDVGRALDAGFGRVKLKLRRGWDVAMVARVREAHPDAVLHVDCNAGFRLEDAPMFRELDAYGLAMIEQPLAHDDLIDHARLQAQLHTPLCLDESIVSEDRARKAIEIGACRWMNLKPGRVGGLTPALAILERCAAADMPCWVGGMLESAIGQGPALALATRENIRYPSDIFPSARLYERDLAEPEVALSAPGTITAPDAPGHGHRPQPEQLRCCTVEHYLLH